MSQKPSLFSNFLAFCTKTFFLHFFIFKFCIKFLDVSGDYRSKFFEVSQTAWIVFQSNFRFRLTSIVINHITYVNIETNNPIYLAKLSCGNLHPKNKQFYLFWPRRFYHSVRKCAQIMLSMSALRASRSSKKGHMSAYPRLEIGGLSLRSVIDPFPVDVSYHEICQITERRNANRHPRALQRFH
jgi:hypothetical protein